MPIQSCRIRIHILIQNRRPPFRIPSQSRPNPIPNRQSRSQIPSQQNPIRSQSPTLTSRSRSPNRWPIPTRSRQNLTCSQNPNPGQKPLTRSRSPIDAPSLSPALHRSPIQTLVRIQHRARARRLRIHARGASDKASDVAHGCRLPHPGYRAVTARKTRLISSRAFWLQLQRCR